MSTFAKLAEGRRIPGDDGDNLLIGGFGPDVIEGGGGDDLMLGLFGDDTLVGNRGDDIMLGGSGDDLLVWNNGDGSDLMVGGRGDDRTQVNFDTDLVDDDLQNADTARIETDGANARFARTELNGQTERGLFALDIRKVETLEVTFGGGDDTAELAGSLSTDVAIELDGGEAETGDTLDLSDLAAAARVDLDAPGGGSQNGVVRVGDVAVRADDFENVVGTAFADRIEGSGEANVLSGGDGDDTLLGRGGDDVIVGNRGDDLMKGGGGDDLLVWNNGDGSDVMRGGGGDDRAQVNFDTDLVDDDLQNADTARIETNGRRIDFARTAVNGQSERGLFALDIRGVETLAVNFGGGDDAAQLVGVLSDRVAVMLNGGDGVDTLDLTEAEAGAVVDLALGAAHIGFGGVATLDSFEAVAGSAFDDTVIGDDAANAVSAGDGEDIVIGGDGADTISGGNGDDVLIGGEGDDVIVGDRGADVMLGDAGDDRLVWNNGDGSDLMNGGDGDDTVRVNFDTDLVNDDLHNEDVAAFSVTDEGVRFARIEVNDQTEFGLFQLDIRETETLETKFGGGDDAAVIVGDVLNAIALDLDGGDGVDLLDFSQASGPVSVDLATGAIEIDNGPGQDAAAIDFEDAVGTDSNDVITGDGGDNELRGGAGNDVMTGGDGADTFTFFEEDFGVDVILDFEVGVDTLAFVTTDPGVTAASLLDDLTQNGDDVELAVNGKVITVENAQVAAFGESDFLIA